MHTVFVSSTTDGTGQWGFKQYMPRGWHPPSTEAGPQAHALSTGYQQEDVAVDEEGERTQLSPQYGHERMDSHSSSSGIPIAYPTSLLPTMNALASQDSKSRASYPYSQITLSAAAQSSWRILPRGRGANIQGTYTGPFTPHYEKIDPCKVPRTDSSYSD
jgi:hypothetical protein